MELTAAHLRYLLAIYEVSQTHLDICSRSIAEKLNVTKPSVVRIMNLLMDRGMIVKEHYNAALALTSALPERAFTGEYDRLFGPDESEKENAS